jgi:hypothetical protein
MACLRAEAGTVKLMVGANVALTVVVLLKLAALT